MPPSSSSFYHKSSSNAKVIEMDSEEYEKEKKTALSKMKRRILILSYLYAALFIITLVTASIVSLSYDSSASFISTTQTYVVSAACGLTCFAGFYTLGNWKSIKDGFAFVALARGYSILTLLTWILSLVFMINTITSYGLINFNQITGNGVFIIKTTALVSGFIAVLVPPGLLRTIWRKTSTADEMFGAEFIRDVEESDNEDENSSITLEIQEEGGSLPYAEPIKSSETAQDFCLDNTTLKGLTPAEFEYEWNLRPVSGSFSCNFENNPTLAQVKMHLTSSGFTLTSGVKTGKDVMEIKFTGYHPDTHTIFFCEFCILSARQYFQATFKVDDSTGGSLTSDFVQCFQLQNLLVMSIE